MTNVIVQTGFAILEGGCTTLKNEVFTHFLIKLIMISLILMTMMETFLQVSIMMKNMIDCLMGGISYWAIGHGLTVGEVNIWVRFCRTGKMAVLCLIFF